MKLSQPYTGLLSALCISLLGACASTPVVNNDSSQPPCWLESPVSSTGIGQIGLAQTIAVGSKTPEEISQTRALAALCTSIGKACDEETLNAALDIKQLAGKSVHFASHRSDGRVYGYAGYVAADTASCAPTACDISACNPKWLCSPSDKNSTGLLGVSYRATNAQAQYDSAVRNALLQAEYMYGVDVTASKRIKSVGTSTGNYRLMYTKDHVDTGDVESIPYYMAHQCRNRSTLFTHVVIDKKFDSTVDIAAGDTSWIFNPKYKGVDGAVGVVENLTASGLMSEQIQLAIKRAAVELAYEKFSHIAEDAAVTLSDSGQVLVSVISEDTQVELKARVVKIHFEQTEGKALKVYAWLAAS